MKHILSFVAVFSLMIPNADAQQASSNEGKHLNKAQLIQLNWDLFEKYFHGEGLFFKNRNFAYFHMERALKLKAGDIMNVHDRKAWENRFGDTVERLKILLELSDGKEPYSMYELGLNYHIGSVMNHLFFLDFAEGFSGLIFYQNKEKADSLFRQAASILEKRAKLGDSKAQYYISFLSPYIKGKYNKPYYSGNRNSNSKEGLEWLYLSALGGYEHAVTQWANFLNFTVRQDYDHRITMNGNAIKEICLQWDYLDQTTLLTDDLEKIAFYWVQKSAMAGDVFSIENMGYFHENGIGTNKDKKKAYLWYKTAEWYGNYNISRKNSERLTKELGLKWELDILERRINELVGLPPYIEFVPVIKR